MQIPKGYWIVVQRKIGRYDRGVIIKSGLTEEQAKSYAEMFRGNSEYNTWAMHKDHY